MSINLRGALVTNFSYRIGILSVPCSRGRSTPYHIDTAGNKFPTEIQAR